MNSFTLNAVQPNRNPECVKDCSENMDTEIPSANLTDSKAGYDIEDHKSENTANTENNSGTLLDTSDINRSVKGSENTSCEASEIKSFSNCEL